MISILETALAYLKQGISITLSDPKSKRPIYKWSEFQQKLPTESQIKAMFQAHPKAMLSIITGELSHIMVVDCDSPEAIQQVEDALPDSFEPIIAVSPRGGRHYYFACVNGTWQTKSAVLKNIDIRSNGGVIVAPPSKNETGGQYRWLTGLDFDKSRLQEMPESLCKLLESAQVEHKPKFTFDLKEVKDLYQEGRRDSDLFHLALSLKRAGETREYILRNMMLVAKTWGEERQTDWFQQKIESAFQHEDKKERNLAEEVREWVNLLVGCEFLVRDCYNELEAVSKQQKGAIRTALHDMYKKGIIEKDKTNGKYRKPNTDEEVIDFVNVTTSCLDIKFPFQIENYVRIMPKNVIVIAGEPDSGKTAFLLNLVKMNMDKNNIFYFSSEMGALEMQDRLRNFDHPIDKWKFKPIERSNDFADVVRPDAVNIIDFLEISDNFYQVSGLIKAIYDKLDKGIAIIALQKNKGTDFGLGGMRSLEKPRLYLSMEPGKLKIVKAKNWVSADKNPNKLSITYKLYKGCHFTPISGWLKPTE